MKRILIFITVCLLLSIFSGCSSEQAKEDVFWQGGNIMGLFDIFKKKEKEPQLSEEDLRWNKIWDLWVEGKAKSPYAELMTYESEINNGGHDQYFFNTGNTGDLEKELSALKQVLPEELTDNLDKAYQAYLVLEEDEENEEAEEVLEECDSFFYENEEKILEILKKYASEI